MELDNFELIEYNEHSNEHKNIIGNLISDTDTKKFLGNLLYAFRRIEERKLNDGISAVYVAYYGGDPVGYISLYKKEEKKYVNENYIYYDSYQIAISILPAYRKQYMASLLLEEFSEKIFELYPEIDKLELIIDNKNIGSIKAAKRADYHEDGNKYSRRRV